MSTLSVQVTGFDDFMADVDRAGVNADPLVRAALQNSAVRIQSNVRDRAPHRTGALQRSVLTTVDADQAVVRVEEKYGIWIEEGTKAHQITPVNKKALFWSGAFSPVKSVMHPGTPARPFFVPGIDATRAYIDETFAKVMERLVTVMAGHA